MSCLGLERAPSGLEGGSFTSLRYEYDIKYTNFTMHYWFKGIKESSEIYVNINKHKRKIK